MLGAIEKDFQRVAKSEGNLLRYVLEALSNPGFRAISLYRIGRSMKAHGFPILSSLCSLIMLHTSYCQISLNSKIAGGFLISHVGGIVIGGNTVIGGNCDIRQNVTFGGNYKKNIEGRTQPIIGENVSFGAGAVVVGPITVGSNSIIGANSVVNRNVPENSIVFGVPGKVVKRKWDEKSGRGI